MERTIKELLVILRDSLAKGYKEGWWDIGICGEIDDLRYFQIISNLESDLLSDYINKNKPTGGNKFSEFTQNKHWVGDLLSFWWEPMYVPETRQLRIDFINALIKEL